MADQSPTTPTTEQQDPAFESLPSTEIHVESCSDGTIWDNYVSQHPQSSVYHLFGFRQAVTAAFGRESYYWLARQGDAVVGVLPVVRLKSALFGDFLTSLPYVTYGGALFDTAAVRDALVTHAIGSARELGCQHLELRDESPLPELAVRTDKITMQLALPGDPDVLFKAIGSKLRAQVRRPGKAGAESFVGGKELLDDFYAIISRKYRDLGVPIYSQRWFEALLDWRPDDSCIAAVKLDGKVVAAGLLLGYREGIEVPYAASLREADRLSVNMLLYWQMMQFSIDKGYKMFDFGRTTPDSGTHRFKRQWGAEPKQLYWHYWMRDGGEAPQLNANNGRYGLAVRAWQKLPVWAANAIGPRIVKNLP